MLNQNLLLTGDDGYNLSRSLRFRASASAYLNRTPTAAGNRKTWTWSAWVKRGQLGTQQWLFAAGGLTSEYTIVRINANDTLEYVRVVGSAIDAQKISTAVYRDPSSWYHIVITEDALNTVARIYVNGSEVTYSTNDNPSNVNGAVNNTVSHILSGLLSGIGAGYVDGYMTEINFIDGQALTPSSFGSTNPATGVWQPRRYTGTYGTTGYYLPFTDNSSLANLTSDRSGNSNNFTANNISLTAGTTYDSMTDVPTLTSATTANYCVLNPLNTGLAPIWGNLAISQSPSSWVSAGSTFVQSTGKYYFESFMGTIGGGNYIGVGLKIAGSIGIEYVGQVANSWGIIANSGNLYTYTSNVATNTLSITATTTMAFQVAVDFDAGKIWLGYNNTWVGGGSPSAGTSPTYTFTANTPLQPILSSFANTNHINFGQRPFTYTPPTGFVALNTFNLPNSSVVAGNKQMDATTYTGNGTTQNIVNSGGFQPDFVWVKCRSAAKGHILNDVIRGAGKVLSTDSTAAESGNTGDLIGSFNSNGFQVNQNYLGGSNDSSNQNTGTFVGWQWKAGGTAVTNTAGSISAQVSANPTAGFSIVTYTGTGANATVGHGLGVAPKMIIVKNRDSAGQSWLVWHTAITGGEFLLLNSTAAKATASTPWNNTVPTSSVFSVGTSASSNNNTNKMVAYCFSEVAGFSSFGSYIGNGSADGTFVHTGFRPRFILWKRTDTTASWNILDTARDTRNVVGNALFPNLANAEFAGLVMDILSNGFKLRDASANHNASGGTYIYMAFAENPFKNSLAR